MNRILLITAVLFLWLAGAWNVSAHAQQVLEFETPVWDFGTIDEADGKVSHEFAFRNVGHAPVAIEQVQTTCGCTVPSFSKAPVKPGGRGHITVTFDPTGRTETFSKSIRVVCNGGTSVSTLRIKGRVRLAVNAEEDYPYVLADGLRSRLKTLFCGNVPVGTGKDFLVELYNASDGTLRPRGVAVSRGRFVNARFPASVPSHTAFSARVSVRPSDGCYGTFTGRLYLAADGKRASVPLLLTGVAVDDVRNMKGDRKPEVSLSETYFKWGKQSVSSRARTYRTRLTNVGNSVLHIRCVECPEGVSCIPAEIFSLHSGENRELVFTVSETAFRTQDEAKVRIITDDSRSPVSDILFQLGE